MNVKPDFARMSTTELRNYVLEHRGDEEALHAYLDKRHAENSGSRVYKSEESVDEAIADYLKTKHQQ